MTDPADHTTRLQEAEELQGAYEREGYADVAASLRYLLDRVRAQSERIEALEAAAQMSWRVYDRFGFWQCGHCGAYGDRDNNADHEPQCIVLTLPAPETVETQG